MIISRRLIAIVLLVCAGATTTALHAQAPPTLQPSSVRQVNGTVVVDDTEPGAPPARRRPFLNSHGMNCASTFHDFGCRNFCSEFSFIFGSCRTFFGQTCTPDAAHFGPDGRRQSGNGSGRCCGN